MDHISDCVMMAFEIRLRAGTAPVDLALRFLEPSQARELIPHLEASPKHVRDFLVAWVENSHSALAVHSIWLEFDMPPNLSLLLPDPVICARLRNSPEYDQVTQDLLPHIHGRYLVDIQEKLFRSAWDTIPDQCSPLYVFSLRARGAQAIRLEIYAEDLETALVWPRRAGHPGAQALVEWLRIRKEALHFQEADRFHVSLTMGPDGWSSCIGLEASFRRQPHRETGWGRLLDGLVKWDLCDARKRQALEGWVGQTRLETGKLVRALSHLKLSFHEEAGPDAKAYLIFQHLD